uniref:Vesicle transport through interaction with t-SNAREs 1A n=1 Tax=Phasianus colchicus TaxID=9054 RepID=A0A669PS30_PHACC
MSSDFESYEQDFAVLTADITGRIGRVPKLLGDEKKQMVANIEKQLEEARELLEQMELEVREIPPQSRGMYSSRMRSYKQEMGKLEADFLEGGEFVFDCKIGGDILPRKQKKGKGSILTLGKINYRSSQISWFISSETDTRWHCLFAK